LGHLHQKQISYSCSPSTLCYKEARPCPIGRSRNLSHFWFTGMNTTKIWGQLTNGTANSLRDWLPSQWLAIS
jgi:hypothetical protein